MTTSFYLTSLIHFIPPDIQLPSIMQTKTSVLYWTVWNNGKISYLSFYFLKSQLPMHGISLICMCAFSGSVLLFLS